MTDLNVALVVKLLDQFSAPGKRLKATMRDLKVGAKEFRSAFSKEIKSGFSVDNLEAAMGRSETRISKAQGRLRGAVGMALVLGAPVVVAGNFEEKLIDFANLAEIDAERVAKLRKQLDELRTPTGQSNGQLLEGLGTLVGKGMGLDEALASLRATGRAAKATGSEFSDMANSGFAVMDNLKILPDQLKKAFDIMALSGKEGSFELQAMARKFPELTAGAKSLKMEGLDAVASLSAALQIAMKAAGSEDQAATNMANFLGKITAPDTVKKFAKFGVNIEKEMQIAAKRGIDPMLHMLKVIERLTGGDSFKMGQLFQDKQVLDFLRALIPNLDEFERIKTEAANADGVIDRDFEKVMAGFNESLKQGVNALENLLSTSGSLLPVFTEIIQGGTQIINTTAAWTAANPELTATLVKGAAGLLAFGIGTRVLGFGFAIIQGGLLRTAALFLKFNSAGKNVSFMAKAFRVLGGAGRFAFRTLRGVGRVTATGLRWGGFLIKPLVWSGKLVPKIGWALLAGKLKWRMLLVPLKWGARLIPGIGWALLAGELLWHFLIKPLGWDKYITADNLAKVWDQKRGIMKWTAIINPIAWLAFIPSSTLKEIWKALKGEISWRDVLDEIDWSAMLGIDRLKEVWKDAMSHLKWPSFFGGGNDDATVNVAGSSLSRALSGGPTAGPTNKAGFALAVPVQNNTFENKPTVTVNPAITITRQQKTSNREIARKAGADTERAVRRGLDDAALDQ